MVRTFKQEREYWITILKQELERERQLTGSKATKKDIGVVLDDYIFGRGYEASKMTKLYIKHGGEYCRLLEIINWIAQEGKFEEYRLKAVKETVLRKK